MDKVQILVDTTRQALIEMYEKMNAMAQAGNVKQAKNIYKQIQLIIAETNQYYDEWVALAVEEEYLRGFDLEGSDLSFIDTGELKAKITDDNFIGLHMESIDTLTTSLYENLSMATTNLSIRVGRMAKDRFAEITKRQALKGALKGDTRKDISKAIVEELTDSGFASFTDKRGRQWQLDSYAEMNARATLREANTRGLENRAIQEGYDLIKVSEHGTTCEICAKYEGRVFSISGDNPSYPKWENHVISKTHPNCRHTVAIFQEKYYAGDVERLRKHSNNQVDQRTEEQKQSYKAMQDKKRTQRQDKLQYFRYKARLGDNAPKSLSGFVQMKKSKNENWKDLNKDFRFVGRRIKGD